MPLPSNDVDPRASESLDAVTLNPDDPFERVVMDIVQTNRRKRKDYAVDGSPFSNFDTTAAGLGIEGFGAKESAIFNVLQKLARLSSLRANGRLDDPQNESVEDTYLDLAVYSIIAYAIHRFPAGRVPETTAFYTEANPWTPIRIVGG